MFRVLQGPFYELAHKCFNENIQKVLACAYDNKQYCKLSISEKQYESITNDENFLPNSYISLNGVYWTLGKDSTEGGTNYRYYIKIHLGGFL